MADRPVAREGEPGPARLSLPGSPPVRRGSNGVPRAIAQRRPKIENAWSPRSRQLPSREARAPVGANAEENLMRAMGAPRTRAITAALMLAIGVAACAADEDTNAPGELPSAEPAAAPSEGAEGPAEAPKEAAEETPWTPGFDADSPAELAKESPDGPGSPAAEPEEDEEEAPEADRE